MYDLHRFRDSTLLRVTFFKAFTSMQRVFLQRLQNAGRRNLICETALLTCAYQEKKPLPTGGQFFLLFGAGLAGKGIFLLKILSSSLTLSFVTSFLLSAVGDMHALTTPFSSISAANHRVNPWFQNYSNSFYQALSCVSFGWQDCAQLWYHLSGF